MKNLLSILIAVLVLCGAVSRADAQTTPKPARVDTRVLSGQTLLTKGEFNRQTVPVFITTATANPYLITNVYDGLFFVNTNMILSLPNPTNHTGRMIQIYTQATNTVTLSNGLGGGLTLVASNTIGTIVLCPSNEVTKAFSTGTNWLVVHD